MLRKLTPCLALSLCAALSACGGGGGSESNRVNDVQLRADAVGTSSSSSVSGLTVQDISGCQSTASGQANVVPICVDDGISPDYRVVNRPFVTVRLCEPGSTTACVNVDHVLVDTGSSGLRIATAALVKRLALPAVEDNTGAPVAECMRFVSGFTWGSLNKADVYIGGLVARNVSLQMMGNASLNPDLGGSGSGAFPNVPPECATTSRDITEVRQEGLNGIIGLSVSRYNPYAGDQYFTCPANVCASTFNFDFNSRPAHLSTYMTDYAGGVAMRFPASNGNGLRHPAGTLTFGIASLPNNATTLRLNSNGLFTTTINGTSYAQSYIDSGSAGLFFDTTSPNLLPQCQRATGLYCPTSSRQFTASMQGLQNTTASVSFSIANAETLFLQPSLPSALNNLGGPVSASTFTSPDPTFAWGFPFFLGRTVYAVMENTRLGGTYGTVAFTSP